MTWKFYHKKTTVSTNIDALNGKPGDVFSADYQTGGKGRLDHKWFSPKGGQNLLMSVVLDVSGQAPEEVATLPIIIGLSVAKTVDGKIKWPNDVYLGAKKVAGILCERHDDRVIAGIGINIGEQEFPPEIAATAGFVPKKTLKQVKDALLNEIAWWHGLWRMRGFAAIHPEVAARDLLRGRTLTIRQTDGDKQPVKGFCKGIAEDGALVIGDRRIYAGEARGQ